MEKMLTDFHFIRKVKHQVADTPANLGPFQLQFIWIVYTLKNIGSITIYNLFNNLYWHSNRSRLNIAVYYWKLNAN